jgi:hypothetical protein
MPSCLKLYAGGAAIAHLSLDVALITPISSVIVLQTLSSVRGIINCDEIGATPRFRDEIRVTRLRSRQIADFLVGAYAIGQEIPTVTTGRLSRRRGK